MERQQAQAEDHGRTALEQALLACVAAVGCHLIVRAGQAFALDPSAAAPLWPAAGFALAATTLWGPGAALGVVLGAALAAPALAALGGAAQALLGAALLRRSASPARFCALVPLLALISPAFGLLALAADGTPAGSAWARAGFTGWIGNAAGLLLAGPLLLAWARAGRERHASKRRLLDSLPMGIMILRLDEPGALRFVDINTAGRALSAAGERPVAGLPLREFAPDTEKSELPAACLSVLASGRDRVLREFQSERVPGAYFNLSLFALGEREVGIAFEDVTEQVKARKSLQDNAQLLLLMIESVREYAIFRVDADGRVSSWSRGAENIYGYAAADILGSPYARLVPPDESVLSQLGRIAFEGRLKSEGWCLRKDASRFWADIVLTALRDEAGAALGFVAVVRDATQRRVSARVMEKRTAELSRSNQELSQFAYVASHDLSAPLHKVKAFGERLRDKLEGKLDEEGRDYLRRMLRAVDGMQALIDALLALARVSTRVAPAEVVDLSALARDVVDGLDHEIAAARARVEIGDLPRIEADPLQMRQLLQNLLSNALKFHKPGETPRVRLRGKTTGDGRCELVVSDNGIGFDRKFAERVFEPFQRLQAGSEYAGTGMGLAICRRIAERHGGTISAASEPGRGSDFTVLLPISQEGRMECQAREKACK
jgi:PAS domain S-box-containing protein